MVRAMRRLLLIILALLIGLPMIYVGVAFGLSIATPRQAFPPGAGIRVFACDNGVHTDLVLPVWTADVRWTELLSSAFPDGQFRPDYYLSFGWGSRDFYINTPHWSDLRLGTALKALLWDETVVHVEYRARPTEAERCGTWLVDAGHYAQIVAHVRASLQRPKEEAALRPVAAGYGPNDVFYAGEGRYTPIETCNQWTGRALKAGGAPVAPWTPFSFLVLWNLPMFSR